MMREFFLLTIILFSSAATLDAQTSLKFDFGAGKSVAGRTRVQAADVYSKELGYGFESGAEIQCSPNGTAGSGYCS